MLSCLGSSIDVVIPEGFTIGEQICPPGSGSERRRLQAPKEKKSKGGKRNDDKHGRRLYYQYSYGYDEWECEPRTNLFDNVDIRGCMDPNAMNYSAYATVQHIDSTGMSKCSYSSCETTPGNGCRIGSTFGGWKAFDDAYRPSHCTNGEVCPGAYYPPTEWATPDTVGTCVSPTKEECLALREVGGVPVVQYLSLIHI